MDGGRRNRFRIGITTPHALRSGLMQRLSRRMRSQRQHEREQTHTAESRAADAASGPQQVNADDMATVGNLLGLLADLLHRHEVGAALNLVDTLASSTIAETQLPCSRTALGERVKQILDLHRNEVNRTLMNVAEQQRRDQLEEQSTAGDDEQQGRQQFDDRRTADSDARSDRSVASTATGFRQWMQRTCSSAFTTPQSWSSGLTRSAKQGQSAGALSVPPRLSFSDLLPDDGSDSEDRDMVPGTPTHQKSQKSRKGRKYRSGRTRAAMQAMEGPAAPAVWPHGFAGVVPGIPAHAEDQKDGTAERGGAQRNEGRARATQGSAMASSMQTSSGRTR